MEARNVFWLRRRVKPRYPSRTKLVPALAISLTVGVVAAYARSRAAKRPLEVMRAVDLDRYLGRWYEIAAYPNRFERGCVATTATYSRLDDGDIRVVNQCREGGFDGKIRTVEGKARVVDSISHAKLKVRFFWPFSGDYWIIGLDPDYRWALVGEPSRQYLWMLARTPTLDPQRYSALTHLVEASGYDPSRLRLTPQFPG